MTQGMADSTEPQAVERRREQNRLAQRKRRDNVRSHLQQLQADNDELRAFKERIVKATQAGRMPKGSMDLSGKHLGSPGRSPVCPPVMAEPFAFFSDGDDELVSDMNATEPYLADVSAAGLDFRHGGAAQVLSPASSAMPRTPDTMRTPPPEAAVDLRYLHLGAGPDPDAFYGRHSVSDGRTDALRLAVANGHLSMVQLLLRHGADVNAPAGDMDRTSLHDAAVADNARMVELLLNHGANARTVDKAGMTALQIAASLGNVEVAGILLQWRD